MSDLKLVSLDTACSAFWVFVRFAEWYDGHSLLLVGPSRVRVIMLVHGLLLTVLGLVTIS